MRLRLRLRLPLRLRLRLLLLQLHLWLHVLVVVFARVLVLVLVLALVHVLVGACACQETFAGGYALNDEVRSLVKYQRQEGDRVEIGDVGVVAALLYQEIAVSRSVAVSALSSAGSPPRTWVLNGWSG